MKRINPFTTTKNYINFPSVPSSSSISSSEVAYRVMIHSSVIFGGVHSHGFLPVVRNGRHVFWGSELWWETSTASSSCFSLRFTERLTLGFTTHSASWIHPYLLFAWAKDWDKRQGWVDCTYDRCQSEPNYFCACAKSLHWAEGIFVGVAFAVPLLWIGESE